MQLKWDDECNILSPILKTQKSNWFTNIVLLKHSTPHIKTVANQYKTDVWLFSIINQIWGKLFKAPFKRGHSLHHSRVREVTSCLTGKFLSSSNSSVIADLCNILAKICKESCKNDASMVLHHHLKTTSASWSMHILRVLRSLWALLLVTKTPQGSEPGGVHCPLP